MAEQPAKPRKFTPLPAPRVQTHPWEPQEVTPEDMGAVRACYLGNAEPHQQRRAMEFIIKQLCGVGRSPFVPGPDGSRATDLAIGKQQVGIEIVNMCSVKSKPGGEQP